MVCSARSAMLRATELKLERVTFRDESGWRRSWEGGHLVSETDAKAPTPSLSSADTH